MNRAVLTFLFLNCFTCYFNPTDLITRENEKKSQFSRLYNIFVCTTKNCDIIALAFYICLYWRFE